MKKIKKYSLLFCIALSCPLYGRTIFPSLSAARAYANTIPEQVDSVDNNNWTDPDFSSFYKMHKPGLIQRMLQWVGIKKEPWNAASFKIMLEDLVAKREQKGLTGDFIRKYIPSHGDYILIWTDLFGAFHSLVRDLEELKKKNIIDDSFTLIKSNYLLVFNGNVVSHSPYSLETLTLVMQLLEKNQNQVIYIRGVQEERQEWHSYSFARELKMRAATVSKESIPLDTLITRFFMTLPQRLYIPYDKKNVIDAVLITSYQQADSGLKEKRFAGFLDKKGNEKLTSFQLNNEEPSSKEVKISAMIIGDDRSTSYQQTEGLNLVGTKGAEAMAWGSFSSPTSRSQKLYDFFNDAFIELSINNGIDTWTLTLFAQDTRTMKGFMPMTTYNIVTGQQINTSLDNALAQKGTQETVTLGATLDLSKSLSTTGKPLKKGLELAFAKAAREGGVGDFIPRLLAYDDEYTPSKTRTLLKNFNKEHIDLFLNSMGSPTNQEYLPYIKEGKILSLFPYTGAPIFRTPDLRYMVHFRIGYVDEGKALAEYALDELNAKKIVIFYQNDAFGKGELEGAMKILEARGFKDVVQVPYERNDVQFDAQAKIIEQVDPDTIFFFAVTPAARSLIRQMGVQFFKGKNLIGTSVYDESFDRFLDEKGLKFLMVRVVPNPKTSNLEIVKEYRKEAEKEHQTPNLVSLEAYINASIFFDVLRRIKPPLTKEKIIAEFAKIKNYNFKGIELNYNPHTHELGKNLWLDAGDEHWIKKEINTEKDISEKNIQKESIPSSLLPIQQGT